MAAFAALVLAGIGIAVFRGGNVSESGLFEARCAFSMA